jgi:molecular chaperone HscB
MLARLPRAVTSHAACGWTRPLARLRHSAPPPPLPLSPLRAFSATAAGQRTAASQSVYTTGASCPGCGQPIPAALTPVCPQCSALLPPPPPATTYYDLFGIAPPSFDIDAAKLKRAFLTLQQKVHPDMFSGRGESEDWAKAWSGRVNDAYKALLSERERAEYLVSNPPILSLSMALDRTLPHPMLIFLTPDRKQLSIHDVTIGEADPVTDPDLLMTIMETREELEDAQSEEDMNRIRDRNKGALHPTLLPRACTRKTKTLVPLALCPWRSLRS